MKKALILLAITALAAVSFTACNPSEIFIKAIVKNADKQYPEDMGDGLTMQSIEYDGKYVTYTIEGDEDLYSFSQDLVTPELKKDMISSLYDLSLDDGNVVEFLNVLRKHNKGIIYSYYTLDPYSEMEVVLEPGEF